jgi:hypothetical protein
MSNEDALIRVRISLFLYLDLSFLPRLVVSWLVVSTWGIQYRMLELEGEWVVSISLSRYLSL